MKHSESIKNIAAAMSKVQASMLGAVTDSENPFFKSKYADLRSVWGACREQLTANGLSVLQPTSVSEHGVIIETMLLHESGEWISGELLITPDKPGPQPLGSAITYGRRYALAAMIGVCPVDDDGERATDSVNNAPITDKQKDEIIGLMIDSGTKETALNEHLIKAYGRAEISELNGSQASVIVTMLKTKIKKANNNGTA